MSSKAYDFLQKNRSFLALSLGYTAWALMFIRHTAYAASDGRLYFNLFDDAMISMRYAWNFAHGHGLVWNVGEYVEGYTNLLLTLLMAVAAFFFEKRYAVLAIQLIGIFFVLGTACLALFIFRKLHKNKIAEHILFVLVLLYYPLNYWSLMGMETGLLAILLCGGVYLALQYAETRQIKTLWGMSICFGLAYLTRNESILLAALAFAYLAPAVWKERKDLSAFLIAGLGYGFFVIAQVIFRYYYYGEIVPNTYTLKLVGMPLALRLQNGWGFMQAYFQETWLFILIGVGGIFYKPSLQKFLLAGIYLITVFYQIYVGGDAWPYWRIMTPAMPLLFIVFILTANDIFSKAKNPHLWIALLSIFSIGFANARFFPELSMTQLAYQNDYARAHVEAAIAINMLTDEEATIGVYWAGTLPYYTGRKAIDFLGKSDKYIASLPPDTSGQIEKFGMSSMPGHNKYDLTYSIQTLKPTYVQEFDWGSQKLTGWAQGYYVRVKYGAAKLHFLKDSPHVKWDKIKDYLQW